MKMDIADVREMMEGDPNMLLVDVRTREEYDAGHIPGAGCLPVDEICDCLYDEALSERGLDGIARSRGMELADDASVIVLYCRTGARSAAALQHMEAIGYVNAYDAGGIVDWPYETVTSAEEGLVASAIAESGLAAFGAPAAQCGCDGEGHAHDHGGDCGCGHRHA